MRRTPGPTADDGKGNKQFRLLLPALLVAVVAAAFSNSFDGSFLFDDVYHVIENERIRQLRPPWNLLAVERPVVELSLAVNYAIGGLNPWGYHALNLVVHILAALTLFGLVRRTVTANAECGIRNAERATAEPPHSPFRIHHSAFVFAFAVAVLWAVHPLQTQTVTYIIQRGESLMGLFYLLTLYCAIRGRDSSRAAWWNGGAIMACALGMASKAVMVTAPIMVMLYDFVFLRPTDPPVRPRRDLPAAPAEPVAGAPGPDRRHGLGRRWVLYAGLAATWGVLWACGVTGEVFDPEGRRSHVGFGYHGINPLEYAATQPGVILKYLRLSVWPVGLCLDYDWPVASTAGTIVPPALVILTLLVVTVCGLVRQSWLGFAGAWFFTILAPTSSFVPIKDPAFEHRMYLPLAAVIAVIALGGQVLVNDFVRRVSWGGRGGRVIQGGIIAAAGVLLAYETYQRNKDYQSDLVMWTDVVAKRPGNARARVALGNALLARNRIDEAIAAYREAVGIRPDFADGLCALGMGLARKGALDEAVAAYRESVRLDPNLSKGYYNLGNALSRQGRIDEATQSYRDCLRIQPRFADAHCNLGNVLASRERLEEAIAEYREAIGIKPSLANAHKNLGDALVRQGRIDEAIAAFREAIRIQPDYANAYADLAAAHFERREYHEALKHSQEALRIDPEHAAAKETLNAAQRAMSGR